MLSASSGTLDLRQTPIPRLAVPAESPLLIPHAALSNVALRGVVEAFILREGTDYGDQVFSLAQKVAQVMAQLQRGEAELRFDPASATLAIVSTQRPGRAGT
ncbi:MAG: YheU family protein [Gammaproteobacteria bacterium]|nr:YheU family protein [Gammaproteobacteria bacterium]